MAITKRKKLQKHMLATMTKSQLKTQARLAKLFALEQKFLDPENHSLAMVDASMLEIELERRMSSRLENIESQRSPLQHSGPLNRDKKMYI